MTVVDLDSEFEDSVGGDGGIGDSMIKPMCWEFYSTGGLGRLYYWSI